MGPSFLDLKPLNLYLLKVYYTGEIINGFNFRNSIGPVMALWAVASTCKEFGMDNCDIRQSAPPQSWIILYGATGIILGLWLLGKRVIQTVGRDIAAITPAR